MQSKYTSSTLEATTKAGKVKYWRISILEDESLQVYTQQEYWQGASVHQFSAPKAVKIKNAGKKNERSGLEQAYLQAESLIKKKVDEGYSNEEYAARTLLRPMAAHTYADHGSKVQFPCAVQPKLDGHRAMYQPGIGFWSKQGNICLPEVVAHITPGLASTPDNWILDGELILPRPYTFNQTTSAIKKFGPLSPLLVYHIFDVYFVEDVEQPFSSRYTELLKLALAGDTIRYVSTIAVDDHAGILDHFKRQLEAGYEGSMVRDWSGVYEPGVDSYTLLKVKEMKDSEFEIIGFKSGEGRDEGAILFICKTEAGEVFDVCPEGSVANRMAMYQQGDSYIGKMYTIRYQELMESGCPRFPIGVRIREDV